MRSLRSGLRARLSILAIALAATTLVLLVVAHTPPVRARVRAAAIAWLHAHGHVIESRTEGDMLHVIVSLDPADRARFDHRRAQEP